MSPLSHFVGSRVSSAVRILSIHRENLKGVRILTKTCVLEVSFDKFQASVKKISGPQCDFMRHLIVNIESVSSHNWQNLLKQAVAEIAETNRQTANLTLTDKLYREYVTFKDDQRDAIEEASKYLNTLLS